jgi:hypothetical protein
LSRGGAALAAKLPPPSSISVARAMTMRIMAIPQRIRLEVADSIWSAAVMTLPFIS